MFYLGGFTEAGKLSAALEYSLCVCKIQGMRFDRWNASYEIPRMSLLIIVSK